MSDFLEKDCEVTELSQISDICELLNTFSEVGEGFSSVEKEEFSIKVLLWRSLFLRILSVGSYYFGNYRYSGKNCRGMN